jgi:hypothetical protein
MRPQKGYEANRQNILAVHHTIALRDHGQCLHVLTA